jgi:hypothetical protein
MTMKDKGAILEFLASLRVKDKSLKVTNERARGLFPAF